jgi:nitrate/TMAO reductase-like tetraheme cytochrome c subunit
MALIRRWWRALWHKPARYAMGTLLTSGVILGIAGVAGFNWAVEATSTESFCISCHSMREFVFEPSRSSVHFSNKTGTHATCADCHVPKAFVPKMLRKIEAAREGYHTIMGTIDTHEKYLAYRPVMANRVWQRMQQNDSASCRGCHSEEHMVTRKQSRKARNSHDEMAEKTCMDCHQGIGHGFDPETASDSDAEIDFSL